MSGHGGRVTREGCELLMTRGMISRDNGKYSFTRDNRVKVCFYKVVIHSELIDIHPSTYKF